MNLILVICIVTLNFIGISYAYWNESSDITAHIAVGNIDPSFKDITSSDNLVINNSDKCTINIEGEFQLEDKESLQYNVINNGSVPIEFVGYSINGEDELILELVDLNSSGSKQLEIQADKPGTYEFEVKLCYSQSTR